MVLREFDVIKSGSMWLGVHHFLFLMGARAWSNSSLSQLTLKVKKTIQRQQSSNNNNNSNNRVQREQPPNHEPFQPVMVAGQDKPWNLCTSMLVKQAMKPVPTTSICVSIGQITWLEIGGEENLFVG